MKLQDRLSGLLTGPAAQMLAASAPLALVSSLAGAAIGTAVALPAFAASGIGMLLFGLSSNLVSSMIYDIVKPGEDDAGRASLIQRGLKAGDPQVITLVAESLIAAGPSIAQALAPSERTALTAGIEQGMREAGGGLARIAPQVGTALRDPSTNWRAAQHTLSTTLASITMTMEASEEGRLSNNTMQSPATGGPVNMTMRASGKGVIEGSSQIVTGGGSTAPGKPDPASTGDLNHQRELLAATIARLQIRELQAAQYGIDVPPHIATEREDLARDVARLRQTVGV